MNIITRFPPSPTGFLHLGRARTALFNYLFAKNNGGKMIFRLEDTDPVRSKKEYEFAMIESLKWLGIFWDNEKIEHQKEKVEIYKKYLKKLIDEDKAYLSKEKIEEGDKIGQENEVIRFRNPNKEIIFTDLIRGDITFNTTELEDFVIARNIDSPLYHLTVVVDDFEMGVTHIIRGDDGISNTPRQILIQEAIGAPKPIYAHLPLILAPDRSKLSGRKGATSVTEYQKLGYLPEALINYVAMLGWNPGTKQEIFSMDELIKLFDISKVQKSGAIFNTEKLNWYNREYLLKLTDEDFDNRARDFLPELLLKSAETYGRVKSLIREKITVFSDIKKMFESGGELAFIKELVDFPDNMLLWKKSPSREESSKHLNKVKEMIQTLDPDSFTQDNVKNTIWTYAEESGLGNVLWPLRVALTGQEKSPDPFTSAYILGKEEVLRRIDLAIARLGSDK